MQLHESELLWYLKKPFTHFSTLKLIFLTNKQSYSEIVKTQISNLGMYGSIVYKAFIL